MKSIDPHSVIHAVAPSILAADPLHLADAIAGLDGSVRLLHVDIMDSHYVPNMHGGPALVKALAEHTDLVIDVHLMVDDPERMIDAFIDAGADILTIHQEACRHPLRWLDYIRSRGVLGGISLNPGTSLTVLDELLPAADLVLLMTVNPGFGGQQFIPESLAKIKACRQLLDQQDHLILLEADGGIGRDNAASIWAAGLDVMVAGSAVFGAEDPGAEARFLESAYEV